MLLHTVGDLNTVEEKYRILYTKQADGTYKLDEGVVVDTTGLKVTNQNLKDEKQALQDKLDALKTEEQKIKEQKLKDEQKYEELITLKEAQLADVTKVHGEAMAKVVSERDLLQNTMKDHVLSKEVDNMSTLLAGDNAAIMKPHIMARMDVNMVDGVPQIIYKDEHGNPGATHDIVVDSFKQNAIFKSVLLGRNSTGGGGNGGGNEGGGDFSSYEAAFVPDSSTYDTFKQQELYEKNPAAHDAFVKKYRLDDPYPTTN